jgi:hypothetical protein
MLVSQVVIGRIPCCRFDACSRFDDGEEAIGVA